MKIVCDSCGAKYSIADEKVQGKVFKIRCKKCSNVIVVKGTGDGDAASSDGLGGAAEWYVVIDGEQVGPVTTVEIESYFSSGKIDAETYGWKDGMGDWMHLVDIAEFAHLGRETAGPNEMTTIADSGPRYDQSETDSTNVVSSPLAMESDSGGGYDDPYGGGYEDDGGYAGFSAGGYGDGGGLAGLGASGDDDDGAAGMFAAFDSGDDGDFMNFGGESDDDIPASNGSNGAGTAAVGDDMVGQRNENSVLFSLSSLDSVPAASGGGGGGDSDTPVTEGSGLIDIQALASAHKSMSGSDDDGGPAIDPFAQGAMPMPALMPMGSHKSNTTLYAMIGAGVFVVLVLAGAVIYMLVKDDGADQQPTKVVEKVIVEKLVERPDQAQADKEAQEAAMAANAATAADPKVAEPAADEEPKSGSDKKSTTSRRKRNTGSSKKAASSTAAEDPAPVAEKPKTKKDGIDNILDTIDRKADKEEAKRASSSSSGDKLTKEDVRRTINRYRSRISTCATSHNKAKKTGTVWVRFKIRENGRVSGASVTSSAFKGTDVGTCVEKVVSSMTFPKSSSELNIKKYPFKLN